MTPYALYYLVICVLEMLDLELVVFRAIITRQQLITSPRDRRILTGNKCLSSTA